MAAMMAAAENINKATWAAVADDIKKTGDHFYTLKSINRPSLFYGLPLESFLRIGWHSAMFNAGVASVRISNGGDGGVRPISNGTLCDLHENDSDGASDDEKEWHPAFTVEAAIRKEEVHRVQSEDRAALEGLADHFPQLKELQNWTVEGVPLGMWYCVKLNEGGRV